MNDDLRELAEAAGAKVDGPIDLEEFVRRTIESGKMLMAFADMLYCIDYDSIWKRYAEELGKETLTIAEKQQAILNAVLEQADGI